MSIIRRIKDRTRPGEDLGLDHGGQKGRQRTINADGSYNMERKTGSLFGNFILYHWLITTKWKNYWLVVFGFYGFMNMFFAVLYYWIGIDSLAGMHANTSFNEFLYCFFFSAQSFTTVGYGGIHPVGILSNFVATLEAFIGLMTFALATGTLYGRFSKPVSRIRYSKNVIIAPFQDSTAMQFMIANESQASLVEMEARVNLSWLEDEGDGNTVRRFQQVKLQIDKVMMFPTSWVINHPIDEESALYGKSPDEIKAMDVEVFALIKGFDEVFSQTIYSKQSFRAHQFVYGAKFKRPFYTNSKGQLVLDLTKVGEMIW